MKHLLICIGLLGCSHSIDRAKNAADNIAYGAELEKCYQAAVDEWQKGPEDGKNVIQVNAEFEACVAAADAKFGVK